MMRQKRIDADKALEHQLAQISGVTHLSSVALRTPDTSDLGLTAILEGERNSITVVRSPYEDLYYAECHDGPRNYPEPVVLQQNIPPHQKKASGHRL
ncbi:hypothetical protein [Thiolapillus sp.]|uniref:hypothetical protein n=1 Tax=Thiolapillus sp. TaxID=2017437 RepID=UPI003AF79F77